MIFIKNKLLKYRLFWSLFLATFFFDQITKALVVINIPWTKQTPTYFLPGTLGYNPDFEPIQIIPDFFYIVHVTNPGAAWGMLAGQKFFLSIFALVVLFLIYRYRKYLELARLPYQLTFGLLIGGIVGNLVDRLVHNHVIDFLDIHLPIINYRWPAFNIADCAIVVGVIIYLIFSLFPKMGFNHPKAKYFDENAPIEKDKDL